MDNVQVAELERALRPVAVKSAAYTAEAMELVPVNATAANRTITLPAAPSDKARIAVKVVAIGAGKTVTVQRGGSDVFNVAGGPTSLSLTTLNQGVLLQYDAGSSVWYAVATAVELPSGSRVAQTLYVTGAPDNSVGYDGDTAVDATAMLRYGPKAGGVWPAAVDLAALGAVGTPAAGAFQKTGSGASVQFSADGVTVQTLTTAGTNATERLDWVFTTPQDLRKKVIRVPLSPSVVAGWGQIFLQIAPSSALAALKLFNIGANTKLLRAGHAALITFCPEMLFAQSGTVDLSAVGLIGISVQDGSASKTISMGRPMIQG